MITMLEKLPGRDSEEKQRAIEFGKHNAIYSRMLELSAQHNLPACFENDLYIHDRRMFEARPDIETVVFMLSDTQTRVWDNYSYGVIRAVQYYAGELPINIVEPDDVPLFFVITPFSTTKVSAQEAQEVLWKLRK